MYRECIVLWRDLQRQILGGGMGGFGEGRVAISENPGFSWPGVAQSLTIHETILGHLLIPETQSQSNIPILAEILNPGLKIAISIEKFQSRTEKVPQRTFVTKISPNFRVNFLVRFASKPLFYCVLPSNCSENSLVLIVRFLGFGVLFLAPDSIPVFLFAGANPLSVARYFQSRRPRQGNFYDPWNSAPFQGGHKQLHLKPRRFKMIFSSPHCCLDCTFLVELP